MRFLVVLACPLVQVGRLFDTQDLPESLPWSSGRVFPPFCPLYCSALGALLANVALFRVLRGFLEGFMGFVWVCLVWCFAWLVWLFVRVNG